MTTCCPTPSTHLPILVIDSDLSAGDQLADYLKHHGFDADVATCCWSARAALRKSTYGTLVAVADLNQRPDLECVAELRTAAPRTWIIVVSLRRYPDAHQVVLGCGADSLLIAPYSFTELLGRLTAFACRSRPL